MSSILKALRKREQTRSGEQSPFQGGTIEPEPQPVERLMPWLKAGFLIALSLFLLAGGLWLSFRAISYLRTEKVSAPPQRESLEDIQEIIRAQIAQALPTMTFTPTPIPVVPTATETVIEKPTPIRTPTAVKRTPVAQARKPIPPSSTPTALPKTTPLVEGEESEGIVVQGIIWHDTRPMAIVNGALVETGSTVEGHRILKIERDGIVLEGVPGIILIAP